MDVGFVGLGNMGGFMAKNVLKAGHSMVVSDILPETAKGLVSGGARLVSTPKEVAEASEVVFTSLPGPRQVEEVALGPQGLKAGLHKGMVYADLSTSTPELIRAIGREFQAHGVDVLDAPVSGGASGAEKGTLAVWVGGDEPIYQRVEPLLKTIGDKLLYCGPLGSGLVCKLCNNLISVGLIAFLPEVFTAGVKAGVSGKTLFDAICSGSGDTWMMRQSIPATLKRVFGSGVGSGIILKDMELGLQLGEANGVPMEIAQTMVKKLREATDHGHGDHPLLWQEQQSGVEVR